jgi:GNAT superfamily N-acetyltransferase
MQITVRVARPDDLAGVDALLSRAYPRLLKADYPPSVLVTALPLIVRAQPALLRCGTYYVAETEAGQIVGAGGWTPDRTLSDTGHIRHVVCDDRLTRRGIARGLIERAVQTAQDAGIRQMECWSTRTAVPFYAAMGFCEIGPFDVPLRAGITFPSVRMMRDLP